MEGIQLSDSGEEEQTSVSSFQEEEKDDITGQLCIVEQHCRS